ncbi:MAG: TlpA disulfide reductase family protein [Bryobacteraceae bacterium]
MTRRLLLVQFAALAVALAQPARLAPLDEAGFQKLTASGKGRVVLVDFWATWCEPCRAEMPQLVALESRYRDRGLKLVAISCDEPEQEAGALEFLKKQRAPLPGYIKRPRDDDKFINAIDAKWSGQLPALFLYDREGRKARSFFGETDMAALEAALRTLL